jgi:DNA polymerase I
MVDAVDTADDALRALVKAGATAGAMVGVVISATTGTVGFAVEGSAVAIAVGSAASAVELVNRVEHELRPRWVWWSNETAAILVGNGVRVARCWDLAAVHRVLFGGWRADAVRIWSVLNRLDHHTAPASGQLDLTGGNDGGSDDDPVRPDGFLHPAWVEGSWADSLERTARWAGVVLQAHSLQQSRLSALDIDGDAMSTARSESAAELLCAELANDGLPLRLDIAHHLIAEAVGPRPHDDADAARVRAERDAVVVAHLPPGASVDLRNPVDVRSMLRRVGIDVPDTRAWRLEAMRDVHPIVDALLQWRKAERISTTFGYAWLDAHVGADGRLRGAWSGSDGAAGRMTAQAGLHNMPADLRPAVVADDGYVFVRADLGQIEPRVLAAVSSDPALTDATHADDLYRPVADRLRVERPIAKVAVLAAMYGQTSGTAGQALRGMDAAYPTAMQFLRDADRAGREGRELRTYGGRLLRMWANPEPDHDASSSVNERAASSAIASRGRYARNAVVQGAAAELFKVWAATVKARMHMLDATIVLCLHDELLIHARADHADQIVTIVGDALTEAAVRWFPGRGVRFVTDTAIVNTWADAKP